MNEETKQEYVSDKSVIKSRKAYQLVIDGADKGLYATLKEAKDAAERLRLKRKQEELDIFLHPYNHCGECEYRVTFSRRATIPFHLQSLQ